MMSFTDLPALGQPLDAGLFAGLTTRPDGTHHAVVLLPDKPAKPLAWKKAVNWAKALGNDAELPTCPVVALLFAVARDQFEPSWHWTSESLDGSCAWGQSFDYGSQSDVRKSYEGRARAVRLIPLSA